MRLSAAHQKRAPTIGADRRRSVADQGGGGRGDPREGDRGANYLPRLAPKPHAPPRKHDVKF